MRVRILLLLICLCLMFSACTPQIVNSDADGSTNVFRFYPEENSQTADPLAQPDEPVEDPDTAPGTLTDAEDVKQPDQALVNKTVKINLGRSQPRCPFLFYSDQGTERLAVVLLEEQLICTPVLIIFETDLGVDGLCDALSSEKTFEAKILSMTNITWQEGMYAVGTVPRNDDPALCPPEEEQYNIVSDVDTVPESGWFFGAFGENSGEIIYGGQSMDDLSEVFKKKLAVYDRIFNRFELTFP